MSENIGVVWHLFQPRRLDTGGVALELILCLDAWDKWQTPWLIDLENAVTIENKPLTAIATKGVVRIDQLQQGCRWLSISQSEINHQL